MYWKGLLQNKCVSVYFITDNSDMFLKYLCRKHFFICGYLKTYCYVFPVYFSIHALYLVLTGSRETGALVLEYVCGGSGGCFGFF